MAQAGVSQTPGARTGEQFLEGLRQGGREIWLNGEMISHPLDHPELRAAGLSMARVFDLQHEHAEEMLAPAPEDPDRLVNVTHLIPREIDDLRRRRHAIELVARISGGTMGRTPDYLNVTFACFAGRADVWSRRGNEQGAANLVAYQQAHARPRPVDDPRADEPAGRPFQAGGRAGDGAGVASQGGGDGGCDRRARGADAGHAGAVRRRAARLSGL